MFGYVSNGQLLAAIQQLQTEVRQLMSEDSTIASEAAAEETLITDIGTSLASIQSLLTSLKGESGLSAGTLAAAAEVETNLQALASTAQADATADAGTTTSTAPATPTA